MITCSTLMQHDPLKHRPRCRPALRQRSPSVPLRCQNLIIKQTQHLSLAPQEPSQYSIHILVGEGSRCTTRATLMHRPAQASSYFPRPHQPHSLRNSGQQYQHRLPLVLTEHRPGQQRSDCSSVLRFRAPQLVTQRHPAPAQPRCGSTSNATTPMRQRERRKKCATSYGPPLWLSLQQQFQLRGQPQSPRTPTRYWPR